MELPIAKQSYLPPTDAMVRAIKRADVILTRITAEETALDGATAFVNRERSNVPFCNCAADLTIPSGATAEFVIDGVLSHFAEAGTRCGFLLSNDTAWPPELARAAEARGFVADTPHTVFLLDSYRPPTNPCASLQIIPARSAYAQTRELYTAAAAEWLPGDRAQASAVADTMIDQLDEHRLEAFLGRIDGKPVGIIGLLTFGSMGVITHLFTHPDHRRKGVAKGLFIHAIDHCQRALFEQVLIEAEQGAPANALYESMGFKPLTSFIRYRQP